MNRTSFIDVGMHLKGIIKVIAIVVVLSLMLFLLLLFLLLLLLLLLLDLFWFFLQSRAACQPGRGFVERTKTYFLLEREREKKEEENKEENKAGMKVD